TADRIDMLGGVMNAGTGIVNIRQKTNGVGINLGGVDGAVLGLASGELTNVIAASVLNIGDANTGAVDVSAVISITNRPVNILSPNTTTVLNGGSLGIRGTVTGPLTANNGGTVRPGSSPGIINSGNLTLLSGSTYV